MLGRFEVLKYLARGATTDLLLARTRGMAGFERHVVIKRIQPDHVGDPAFVQAFTTEARIAAALHHNNIIQVQDIAEDGGAPYFAMEYVHGEDVRTILAQLNQRGVKLPLEHIVTIITAAATALHHAHESTTPDRKPLNLVHRDVTPSNLLVAYDGNVKVLDFGIAKAEITIKTQVGQLKGRAPYMAPEQCMGEPVDRRTDVFALGIVLWEMTTMRRLFRGATEHETMRGVVSGVVPRPTTIRPDIPAELESIIMKALAKLPRERFQSAADLGRALETCASACGLAASTAALANFLTQQLGTRPEPWLVEGETLRENWGRVRGRRGNDGGRDDPAEASGGAIASETRTQHPAADARGRGAAEATRHAGEPREARGREARRREAERDRFIHRRASRGADGCRRARRRREHHAADRDPDRGVCARTGAARAAPPTNARRHRQSGRDGHRGAASARGDRGRACGQRPTAAPPRTDRRRNRCRRGRGHDRGQAGHGIVGTVGRSRDRVASCARPRARGGACVTAAADRGTRTTAAAAGRGTRTAASADTTTNADDCPRTSADAGCCARTAAGAEETPTGEAPRANADRGRSEIQARQADQARGQVRSELTLLQP